MATAYDTWKTCCPETQLSVCEACGGEYPQPDAGADLCGVCWAQTCDSCRGEGKCHRNQCENCLDWYEEKLVDVEGEMMCGECAANAPRTNRSGEDNAY